MKRLLLIVLLVPLTASAFSLADLFNWAQPAPIQEPKIIYGAPVSNVLRNVLPETTNMYDIGTSTKIWNRLFVNYASTTALNAVSLCLDGDTCRTTWPSASASFPFDVTAYGVSTSTIVGFTGGLMSMASSTFTSNLFSNGHAIFASFFGTIASTTNATSTNLTVTGNTILSGITSALVLTGSDGLVAEYAGTSCTNQFPRSLSALGAATCATVANTDLANSTISGVALGSDLAALTNDTTLNGSSYNGSSAISDWGINLANENTWTGLQQFSNSTSTLGTITTAWIGTLNLTNDLTVANGGTGASTLTGCLTGNGTGAITGSGTCNTSNATVSSIATTYPITGGTITTTGTIALAFGTTTSNTWAGTQTFETISNTGGYTQSGTTANTFTGTPTFSNATYSALFTGGNVGIGVNPVNAQLEISHSLTAGTIGSYGIRSENTAGSGNWTSMQFAGVTQNAYIGYLDNATAATQRFAIGVGADTSSQFTILGSGNVGIGTTGPLATLHISGGLLATASSTISGLLTATNASTTNLTASDSLFVNSERVYGKQDKSFTVASSTLAYSGWASAATSSLMLWNPERAITITDFYCKTFKGSSGTSTVAMGSGTATSTLTCATDVPSSGNTGLSIGISARGNVYFDFGGAAGSAAYFTPTISFTSN